VFGPGWQPVNHAASPSGWLVRSPIDEVQTTPRVIRKRVEVLSEAELATLLGHLEGAPLYTPVLVAAYTGLRRAEVLGLRWADLDFNKGALAVTQQVEVISGKLHVKAPKTDNSRRIVTLPAGLVPELKAHRKRQAELRLQLGLSKDAKDLVFTEPTGQMVNPDVFSYRFTRAVTAAGLKHVTFHGLRHTHITHLLRAGVPARVVSGRAGHANTSMTLHTYAHLLDGDDEAAAALADDILRRTLK
jgi:integrase